MIGTMPATVARSRELVPPALAAWIERLAPQIRRVARYHLGWTDADGRPAAGNGGKGLRPTLALLSAEAAGAPVTTGLPGAVAVELVHNFSLLHDDVIDRDRTRRHRPTAWALFGIGPAVVTGDALLVLAHQALLAAGPRGPQAASAMARATADMISGQAEDLSFSERLDVGVEECLAMAGRKTGALLACAASVGALLAGAPARTVGALEEFGYQLGVAFQCIDDVLGIWGRPETTGKPAGGDLREHKKTLPVAAALAAGGTTSRALADLLANGRLHTEEDVAFAARLVEEAGGRALAAAEADRHLDGALAALDRAAIPSRVRDELAEVARFVVAREF